jgi:hypothetical protein
MKLQSFLGLLLVAVLAIGSVDTASAQREKKNRRKKAKIENVENAKIPNDVKRILDSITNDKDGLARRQRVLDSLNKAQAAETFDNAKLPYGVSCHYVLDNGSVLTKGDSTRIKYLINPKMVIRLEVFGYGEATPEDIKNGEWIITVRPEKTMHLKTRLTYSDGQSTMAGKYILVVDDPQKFKDEYNKLPREKKNEFYRQAIGETFYDECEKELREYNRNNFKPTITDANGNQLQVRGVRGAR